MPLVPALARQKNEDILQFWASMLYKACSRTARAVMHKNPVSKTTKHTKAREISLYSDSPG